MNIKILLITVVVLSFLDSCGGDKTTNSLIINPKVVKIKTITPDSGKTGDIIRMTGVGFGSIPDSCFVLINGVYATEYLFINDSILKFKVPYGAGTGKVWVITDGIKSNEVDFKVFYPSVPLQLLKILPDSAYIGDVVSIIGTSFGKTRDTSKVTFNSVSVIQYVSWSDSLIIVKVPDDVTNVKIAVTINGKKSNELDFIIKSFNYVNFETVTIGTQVWLQYNMNVSCYRNGDIIPEVRDSAEWAHLKTGAWCYYNNDPANGAIYGKLYNWYAINDTRGLAPAGWHIPNDSDWKILTSYLGGIEVAGGKLKEAGTTHWQSPNLNATNESGFSGLPGGYRIGYFGSFRSIGSSAIWWTYYGTDDVMNSFNKILQYDTQNFYGLGGLWWQDGYSLRCLKD